MVADDRDRDEGQSAEDAAATPPAALTPADAAAEPLADGPAAAAVEPAADYTTELARLLALKHTELGAKGFPEGIITASVKRSLAYAQGLGASLSPEIREAGTLDLLRADLVGAETWCENYQASMTE